MAPMRRISLASFAKRPKFWFRLNRTGLSALWEFSMAAFRMQGLKTKFTACCPSTADLSYAYVHAHARVRIHVRVVMLIICNKCEELRA